MTTDQYDAKRIRERLPDYFEAIEMPWHLAAGFMAAFVNDDEEPLGVPDAHARSLFHVAKALDEELRAAHARGKAESEEKCKKCGGYGIVEGPRNPDPVDHVDAEGEIFDCPDCKPAEKERLAELVEAAHLWAKDYEDGEKASHPEETRMRLWKASVNLRHQAGEAKGKEGMR